MPGLKVVPLYLSVSLSALLLGCSGASDNTEGNVQSTKSTTAASNKKAEVVDVASTKPKADASLSSNLNWSAPLTVNFNGKASKDDGPIFEYSWKFDDGGPSIVGAVQSHTYEKPGTYTATLTILDGAGNTDTDSVTVNVQKRRINQAPIADLSRTTGAEGDGPLTVSFDASASIDDKKIVSYGWDFGDGSNGTGSKLEHTYTSPGTFTAVLTVKDEEGLSSVSDKLVRVGEKGNLPPIAAIVAFPRSGVGPLEVRFNGKTSTDDGNIADYRWNFGDGVSAEGAIAVHKYTAPGNYDVQLTVTDAAGLKAVSTVTVTVKDAKSVSAVSN